jgi:hypothetical protein
VVPRRGALATLNRPERLSSCGAATAAAAGVVLIVAASVAACRGDARAPAAQPDSGGPCTLNVDCDSGAPGAGDPPAGSPCVRDGDCAAGQYCHKPSCHAATGTCAAAPELRACAAEGGTSAVCGCDHKTYGNACEARSMGVDVAAAGACPPLPSGPCTSQADCGGADYAQIVFCKPTTCGAPAGRCVVRPDTCVFENDFVCGCDGTTYQNVCWSDAVAVGLAYGGPCRSGALVACGGGADDGGGACGGGQVCAFDPRCPAGAGADAGASADASPGGGGVSCPGVCLDTPAVACGPFEWNDAGWLELCGSATQLCAALPSTADCDAGPCGACVYTTGATCDGGASCSPGQLCVPAIRCGGQGPCAPSCVVP